MLDRSRCVLGGMLTDAVLLRTTLHTVESGAGFQGSGNHNAETFKQAVRATISCRDFALRIRCWDVIVLDSFSEIMQVVFSTTLSWNSHSCLAQHDSLWPCDHHDAKYCAHKKVSSRQQFGSRCPSDTFSSVCGRAAVSLQGGTVYQAISQFGFTNAEIIVVCAFLVRKSSECLRSVVSYELVMGSRP